MRGRRRWVVRGRRGLEKAPRESTAPEGWGTSGPELRGLASGGKRCLGSSLLWLKRRTHRHVGHTQWPPSPRRDWRPRTASVGGTRGGGTPPPHTTHERARAHTHTHRPAARWDPLESGSRRARSPQGAHTSLGPRRAPGAWSTPGQISRLSSVEDQPATPTKRGPVTGLPVLASEKPKPGSAEPPRGGPAVTRAQKPLLPPGREAGRQAPDPRRPGPPCGS